MSDPAKRGPELQLASPSYRLAALDQDFLLADAQRGLRFQLEYEKAEQALRAWGVRSTVVVFGSARMREDGPGGGLIIGLLFYSMSAATVMNARVHPARVRVAPEPLHRLIAV